MKSLTFKILGATSFLIGCVFVLNSFFGVTGFIIAEFVGKRTGSLIGLAFIIIGILLFLRGRLEHSLDLFKSRGIITDPKKLKKVAGRIIKQRGHSGREVKEGYQILDKRNKPLTVIPRHISKGVYFGIRDALLTGEPNFRRTNYSN